jgi:hypothetical protein
MSRVGGYREGIEKMADAIKTRGSATATPTLPTKPEKVVPETIPTEAISESPDFVVDVSSLKDRAQKLLDSGLFEGEELTFLKDVAAGKES